MSICNNALSNIKTTKNKNRLTFVLELMWKTDEEIEVKKNTTTLPPRRQS